jgi:hypothetical protein
MGVAGQFGEFAAQAAQRVAQTEAFERAEAQWVEQDGRGRQLRQARAGVPLALLHPRRQQPPLPGRLEHAAKIVNLAKKFGQAVHGRLLFER